MIRVGLGFDVHPFGGDGPLVLGGVDARRARARRPLRRRRRRARGRRLAARSGRAPRPRHAVPGERRAVPRARRRSSCCATSRAKVHGERWWVVNVDVVVAAEAAAPRARTSPRCSANLVAALEPVRRADGPRRARVGHAEAGRGDRLRRPHRGHRGVGRRAARARPDAAPAHRPARETSPAGLASPDAPDPRHDGRARGGLRPPRARARVRCTSAARPSTTSRTSATAAPRSSSTSSSRYLEWSGLAVTYVSNITNVEDKIIARAAKRGRQRAGGRGRGTSRSTGTSSTGSTSAAPTTSPAPPSSSTR